MDSKHSDDNDSPNDPNDPNDTDANDIDEDIEKMKKKNSCNGVIIAFVCIVAILVIIYFIIINVVPKKGVFQPITKCTTCPDALLTCQSATEKGSYCNWCRPLTKGTNTRAAICYYGHTYSGKNGISGNWINAAWDVKSKKDHTKNHKEYKYVAKYKIASVHHPDGKAICVPLGGTAICENCTSIAKGNKCLNMANYK